MIFKIQNEKIREVHLADRIIISTRRRIKEIIVMTEKFFKISS